MDTAGDWLLIGCKEKCPGIMYPQNNHFIVCFYFIISGWTTGSAAIGSTLEPEDQSFSNRRSLIIVIIVAIVVLGAFVAILCGGWICWKR
jgi:hypothetical protein